uniref:Transketolase-like pyrimidine-binding domain-containing protein n=1 Tax=Dendroctonus ponderosae TaxID=77166 RepID=A0AAR5PEB4_DENPD
MERSMHKLLLYWSHLYSGLIIQNTLTVMYANLLVKGRYLARFYHSDYTFGYRKLPKSQFKLPSHWLRNRSEQSNLYRLICAFRSYGHKYASTNPVALTEAVEDEAVELDISRYGFQTTADKVRLSEGIVNFPAAEASLDELLAFLRKTYCKYCSAEFDYLETEEEREWFAAEFERLSNQELTDGTKIWMLKELIRSQAFDHFLAKRFSSVKRYGGEGAESMMVFFQELFHLAAEDGLEQVVLAMPHRGRLNLLTGLLNYPPVEIFSKLGGKADFPDKYQCDGDVLSHIISSTDLDCNGKPLHVSVLRNPSHLEAVNPVSMGKSRAKQLGHFASLSRWGDRVLNVQVHGDAALSGQGINQECLELSAAPHFEVGGSVHLVVNNQVGFTTPADRGRSSRYCTDVAKIVQAPVLHVNGDHPEEVLKATRLAVAYQRKFRKDVFVDMCCFRRWGHNEMDEPTFTNPALYSIINARSSVPDLYAEKLSSQGIVSEQECSEIYDEHFDWLNEELQRVDEHKPKDDYFKGHWQGFSQAKAAISVWNTGVDADLLASIGEKSVNYPESFNIHPTILRGHIKNRLSRIAEGTNIDWSTAEALAIGSLLLEGQNVRISGQDIGRGTFSQRHAMLVDQKNNTIHVPLNNLHPNQRAFLELANSILSEEAVLGFEYGMSIETPETLVIWEAQFGDFFNGAQIIFDTFITSGEAKWIYQSGLTVLLPHGYDGAGPEHSCARVERFLQLTDSKEDQVDGDNVNLQVCQPSTPAQYFHLLRRQMVRNYRKPLVIITPKTLLRAPQCVSGISQMVQGTHFRPVLGDDTVDPSKTTRVLLTSGKHYYSLAKQREAIGETTTAILRVESFCPFPTGELLQELAPYKRAKSLVWCQEEPQNMGAWTFFKRRFENLIGRSVRYCGRPTQAVPAVGVGSLHQRQEAEILTRPFLM